MKRFDIINKLIETYNYTSYLEIGVRNADDCFNKIHAINKIGVDPDPNSKATINVTSDLFFETNRDVKFDIIFIDGLHLEFQVTKDIENAIKHLNPNGCIVLHDCNPLTEFHQRETYEVDGKFPAWNGTTWKAFVKYRMNYTYYSLTVDTDHGCGIIMPDVHTDCIVITEPIDYINLDANRQKWLNLISINEFSTQFSISN